MRTAPTSASPVAWLAIGVAAAAFAVLTYDGLRGAQVAEDILKAGGHPLSKSFMAGHELIAYLRAASEAAANAKRQPTDPRH